MLALLQAQQTFSVELGTLEKCQALVSELVAAKQRCSLKLVMCSIVMPGNCVGVSVLPAERATITRFILSSQRRYRAHLPVAS